MKKNIFCNFIKKYFYKKVQRFIIFSYFCMF